MKRFGTVMRKRQALCNNFRLYVDFTLREFKIHLLLSRTNSQENANICFVIFPMYSIRHEIVLDQEFVLAE